MTRRINRYSNGILYTEYRKVCKNCLAECWIKKNNIYCSRACSNESMRTIRDPLEHFFREKLSRLRSNAKKRKKEVNLEWIDLLNQYSLQKGRCFYTGLEMMLTYSTKLEKICPPKQLSIDRLDSSKGYSQDNIVLCLFCINNFKGEMSILEFKELLEEIRNESKN